jgi:hypothetical protein
MTATTSFSPRGIDGVSMDILVGGPLEELKKVNIVGPCMQFWHSDTFKRENNLVDFAERCFLYTIRGPVGMMDTGRGPMKDFALEAAENHPPWTQWYVPIKALHPGDIWAFGASGDRPLHGLVGVSSRDGHWLSAMGCMEAWTLGQGWHDCIHLVPQMQAYLDEKLGIIQHRSMIYVMPNDKRRLLEVFRRDFPVEKEGNEIEVSAGPGGSLRIVPVRPSKKGLNLSLRVVNQDQRGKANANPAWKVSPWGGFIRRGESWNMWAFPRGDAVELWVSLASGTGLNRVEAAWSGKGWVPVLPPRDVPALALRSPDGLWIAALTWEQNGTSEPSIGIPIPSVSHPGVMSIRGRIYLYRGEVEALRERWTKTRKDWEHSRPYYMPLKKP